MVALYRGPFVLNSIKQNNTDYKFSVKTVAREYGVAIHGRLLLLQKKCLYVAKSFGYDQS